jgi:uncharacterized membrane protein
MITRSHLHIPHNPGDHLADLAVGALGNWNFIIIQASILLIWFVLNSVGWFYHWDGYPFILCNLFMSAEAAFSSPLILMSQNRQAMRDRGRDDIEADEVNQMLQINQQQLAILHQQHEILQALNIGEVKP